MAREIPCAGRIAAALDAIFDARSVALIGVSGNSGHISAAALRNLRAQGFAGRVYVVNPGRDAVDDLPCWRTVAALPEAVDVAVVMVRAERVIATIAECGERGIRAAVVLTSGFEETATGKARAAALRETARQAGVSLIGPNCEGIWSVGNRLALSFGSAAARTELTHAPIAIVSQSGAVAGALARHLQDSGTGCSYVVSSGNETSLDSLDILAWLIGRDDVRVVLMFIEGWEQGSRILALAERARARGIRIVALKSGNSEAGRQATASHTGKLASSYRVYRDIFRQAGIVLVERIEDLVAAARVFLHAPLPRPSTSDQSGVAIFSIPGGTRALTMDLCAQYGVPACRFTDATLKALRAILPPYAQAQNPTDMTGEILSSPQLFEQALALILADENPSSLIVQLANRGVADLQRYTGMLADHARRLGLPVIVSMLGDSLPLAEQETLARKGIVFAQEPADAVRYLGWLYQAALPRSAESMETLVKGALVPRSERWGDMAAYLESLGVPVVRGVCFSEESELRQTGSCLAPPFAVKALPEHAAHKSELGLVALNVPDLGAANMAAQRLRGILGDPQAAILVQEMAAGVEAVLAIVTDKDFGPVLTVGTGGQGIELWDDVGFLALPAGRAEIYAMIDRLKLGTLLRGFRGAPAADIDALVAAAIALTRSFVQQDELEFIELNPVFIGPAGTGVRAADILVRFRQGNEDDG